jgi:hypothetical protein
VAEQPAGAGRLREVAAGVFRFLSPVMTVGVRRQVRADHRRLKTVLEGLAPVSGPGR